MKIHYPKKRLKSNLIFGIIWSLLGITAFTFDTGNLFNFGYIFFGFGYLAIYFFEKTNQYLTIENGWITKHNIRPKRMKLDEINHIKKFAGDYVLKTDQDELTINISNVEKNSLLELENVLEGLHLNDKETVQAQSNLP